MKKSIHYIIWLFALSLVFVACEGREPDLFDKDSNGAYFDYGTESEFEKRLNFGDYIVGRPDTVSVMLKVKLLGYLMDDARTLSIKTKDVEGYDPADILIEKVVFANKEYEKLIEVKVMRPAVEDRLYAVCIYLDGSGDIGTGIDGMNEINLFVEESYTKPDVWGDYMDTYLGEWSKEKHIYLALLKNNNSFFSNLYDSNKGGELYDSIVPLNVAAVNDLLANEPGEGSVVDFPILEEREHPAYTAPYFWGEYESVLGMFRADKFCRFTTMLGGSTTRDVAGLYASEDARAKMVEEAENFHKDDFLYMLNEYYKYALMGYPISEYKNLCWVKMNDVSNYRVRIPYWWEDPNGLGAGDSVKKYFGDYSDEKYKFMLVTMLAEDGADNFITESILPFVYDKENGTYAWDNSPFGTDSLCGRERLKKCYSIIKAANTSRPPSRRFDIPNVTLD